MVNSGPQVDETLTFTEGSGSSSVSVFLVILQDEVALENDEVFSLALSSASDPRVIVGGSSGVESRPADTEVTIVDDDGRYLAQYGSIDRSIAWNNRVQSRVAYTQEEDIPT